MRNQDYPFWIEGISGGQPVLYDRKAVYMLTFKNLRNMVAKADGSEKQLTARTLMELGIPVVVKEVLDIQSTEI